jgi:hypothetical protein
MKTSDIAKVAFVVVALGTAAVVAYNVLLRPSPADQVMIDHLCLNPACGADFQVEQGEMNRRAKARESITCPKCGSYETDRGHRCGNCNRVNKSVGHTSPPPKCTFCKQPWTYAKKPK